jgi:uncharacterized membrane protein (Fun14 family)
MNVDSISSIAATISGGFFIGVLIGYALKKIIRIAAIIVGLFLGGLAYLQYQQIANIKWDKVEYISEGAAMAIINATTTYIPGSSDKHDNVLAATMMSTFGIPLTGSMASGFTIGFLKG